MDLKQAAISLGPDAPAAEVADAQAKLLRLRRRISSCDSIEPQSDKMKGVLAADLGGTLERARRYLRDLRSSAEIETR